MNQRTKDLLAAFRCLEQRDPASRTERAALLRQYRKQRLFRDHELAGCIIALARSLAN